MQAKGRAFIYEEIMLITDVIIPHVYLNSSDPAGTGNALHGGY